MTGRPTLVWFRDDLRVADHPALHAAIERGRPVVAAYVLDEASAGVRPLGGAARWWLHGSLAALAADLDDLGIPLVLRRGPAAHVVRDLVAESGADAVTWNRRYGAAEREVDSGLKAGLRAEGIEVRSFPASLLYEPWTIRTGAGAPYAVFTPFWRTCLAAPEPRHPLPVPSPARSHAAGAGAGPGDAAAVPDGEALEDWTLRPTAPDWAGGLRATWTPGAAAAHQRLAEFVDEEVDDYADGRDRMGHPVVSRLSPHLRFGELSPFEAWEAVRRRPGEGAARFRTELGWREFAWHVAFHAEDLATRNLRPEFDAFPWPPLDHAALEAWRHGRTGVPLVDAGMRELWETGSMHNRVRMVVASFLAKHLRIDWRLGEQWFWDTLVDADAASNPFNWQWVAGSGADAAPYFRVFNPEAQAAKFDRDGAYVRRWVPEAGTDAYPEPIIDLAEGRRAALEGYEAVKSAAAALRAAGASGRS
ncbi:cryptochrome/photolyase family protein [Agromyces sp. MMS24-K17]|uniref:cryptochrome/photolyase family protein n=1 Tax=Agromyces sp. MMS24-K17 TaxID=3372850 RepID=UPI003754DA24